LWPWWSWCYSGAHGLQRLGGGGRREIRQQLPFLIRQVIWAALGLAAMVALMNVDYRRLANPAAIFPALGLQLILLVVVLFADTAHNTTAGCASGDGPAALRGFKTCSDYLLAYFLRLRQGAVNDWKHTLLPIGLVTGASVALIMKQPDFERRWQSC